MAALVTCTSDGLMPHARQGGRGVCSFTKFGSKFDGTGFEKEHIGQIHVAVLSLAGAGEGATDLAGDPLNLGGEALAGLLNDGYVGTGLLITCVPRLDGFGKSVTFGDDLTKKPALLRCLADEGYEGYSTHDTYIEFCTLNFFKIDCH